MPPVPTNHLKLKRFSLKTPNITLIDCAMIHEEAAVQNM